jgi:malectin (di-glucose binding ER protein)
MEDRVVKKFLGVLVFLVTFNRPATAQTPQPIRVHCGGLAYTDSNGQTWQADTNYSGGSVYSTTVQIGGTADQPLYQTGRQNSSGSTPLLYSFPVANGSYNVNLLFAETSSKMEYVGARVFNVKIQGTTAFSNLDVFAAAGARAALVKSTNVLVQNGTLSIEFDNVVQAAKVDAIEILPVPAQAPQLTLNFVYPDGTPVLGTLAYSVTSSLLSFQGSEPLTYGQAQCVLFASPSTMGISAQFQVQLSLTDTAGHVLWQLSMQANPAQVNLAAVQSSTLNVVVQKI